MVATEAAVRGLAAFDLDPRTGVRVLADLECERPKARAEKVSGMSRPLWVLDVSQEISLAFTIGVGEGGEEEVRILYAGPSSEIPTRLELMSQAGELDLHRGAHAGQVLASRLAMLPEKAWALFASDHETLDDYLVRRPLTQPAMESLSGARFRVLAPSNFVSGNFGSLPPEDLPLRLGPRQIQLLDARRPLLVQGVAGSGKTTVLTHFAVRRLAEGRSERALFVVFNEGLRQYVHSLLSSLGGGRGLPEGLSVLTFREICSCAYRKLALDDPHWIDGSQIVATLRVARQQAGLAAQITIDELLDEIRANIKGPSLDPQSPLIPYSEYESVGRLHATVAL